MAEPEPGVAVTELSLDDVVPPGQDGEGATTATTTTSTTFPSDASLQAETRQVPLLVEPQAAADTPAGRGGNSEGDGEGDEGGSGGDTSSPFRLARTSPMSTMTVVSRWLFLWITPLIRYGNAHTLNLEDLFSLPRDMKPRTVLTAFQAARARKGDRTSIVVVILSAFWRPILRVLVVSTLFIGVALVGPIVFLRGLIQYAGEDGDNLTKGLLLALGLFCFEVIRSMTVHQFWFSSMRIAVSLRTAVYALVYTKAMAVRDLGGYSVGELVNICSNDGQRIYEAGAFSYFIYMAILSAAAVVVYGYIILGPAALAGFAVYLMMFPLQTMFAKVVGRIRRQVIGHTDKRVRLMNEIITCVKLIKMYAWEKPFSRHINAIRSKEKRLLQHAGYFNSFNVSLTPAIPVLAAVATFTVHAYVEDSLTEADAFSMVALFNFLRFPLAVLPMGVKAASEAVVGVARLEKFLLVPERGTKPEEPSDEATAVQISDGVFAWHEYAKSLASHSDHTDVTPDRAITVLRDINLSVQCRQLIGICGGVGSGKSSLLSAVMANMDIVRGRLARRGRLAFVSQQAWIQSDTLRNNILFGRPYDEKRYRHTIEACSLLHDLEVLPAGDKTEIGERGINVSGGQKQRISLARAVYADHDIYLLDDPLSAVDAHVGKAIFTQCLTSALKDKTILFVTHQLQYLPFCDRVLFMKGGRIEEEGEYEELRAANKGFAQLMAKHFEATEVEGEEAAETEEQGTDITSAKSSRREATEDEKETGRNLITKEKREKGAVASNHYFRYARAGGGVCVFVMLLLGFLLSAMALAFTNWWLSFWIREGDGSGDGSLHDNPDRNLYAMIYGLSGVGVLVIQAVRGYFFTRQTLKASSALHKAVFVSIVRAPMSFFDTTPTGRILNRFSKDMDEVDVRLPTQMEPFLQNLTLVLVNVAVVALIFPYFLVALLPISAFFFAMVRYYRPSQRELKRLDNVSRSPLFSHLSASLQGLETIHAFGATEQFSAKLFDLLETNTEAWFAFLYSSRWFAFRLDFTTTFMVTSVALFSVFFHGDIDASLVALALTFVLSMSGMFQYTTRLYAEVEARFTSVSRINDYILNVPHETVVDNPRPPPADWPAQGRIEFRDFATRYRPGLPLVLKGVSLSIRAAEKIGIAGRTGSGKSTLTLSLFRILEGAAGTIHIDGEDLSQMGLEDLRSKLSIIPQDPVLFVGTIRYNLDPFDQRSDAELWAVLERAHIKEMVAGLDAGLMAPVTENGDNFSVGERQLICMARALLRHSKILAMDEATAAIDTHTDALIQQTIREAFSECTVLTVAHRLNTIMDSDRILILEDGGIAEFDTPQNLLKDPNSHLSQMVAHTDMSS